MTYKANHRILHVKYSHLLALNGTFYGTFTAHLRHINYQQMKLNFLQRLHLTKILSLKKTTSLY